MSASSPWFKASCRVALGVAAVLVAETALATQAGAVVTKPTTATQREDDPDARKVAAAPDEASALLKARLQDRRLEILDKRTASSTTWANPDGTMTTQSFAGPVRAKDKAGAWRDIDTKLADVGGAVRPQLTAVDAAFSPGGSKEPLARMAREGKSLALGWAGELPQPVLEGNTATYPGAVDGGDLAVAALPEGFSHSAVLKKKPSRPLVLRFAVNAPGLRLQVDDEGALQWTDGAGKTFAYAAAPQMWDAAKDPKSQEPKHRARVTASVEDSEDGQVLVLRPDPKFFAAEDLTYPITIDAVHKSGPTTDTWMQYTDYPNSQGGSTELKTGTYNGGGQKARSYLKFNSAPYVGFKVTNAKLALYSKWSSSCATNGSGVEVRRVTSAWETATIKWSTQPSTTATGAVTSKAAKGYNSTCPAGWVDWNMTAIAQAWASGQANHGIRMAGVNENDSQTWRRYHSANHASIWPSLEVTYNRPPNVPAKPALAPMRVDKTGKAWTTTKTPTGSVTPSDPDGGQLKVGWAINKDSVRFLDGETNGASGVKQNWKVPAGKLAEGDTYVIHARAHDGHGWSRWSSGQTFTVLTAKPPTPKITSDDFPPNTWGGERDGDGNYSGSFTATPSGSHLESVLWRWDDQPWKEIVTADATPIDVTVPAGEHTLQVKTRNKAGLESTPASYTFLAGDGAAVQQPAQGDRPARRTLLMARGKNEYTQVTFEYRRGDEDTWRAIPAEDVTTTPSDDPIVQWPQTVTNGRSRLMVWNMARTLREDGPIQVRAAFGGGEGVPDGNSPATRITFDRDAGTAPTNEVGPGQVNMLTGNLALSETDASAFDLSVTRTVNSRKPGQDTTAQGQAPIFGPSWVSGVESEISESEYTGLRKTSNTSVAVTFPDGDEIGFNAAQGDTWVPEVGAEDLTLTGSLARAFTLTDDEGTITVFTKADPALTTWQVSSSRMPEENSTTRIISEKTTVDGKELARPKYAIAPTSAAKSEACEANPATKGCRMLEFIYATSTTAGDGKLGDFAGRAKEIRLWATTPGGDASTPTAVAAYGYDAEGRLLETWDPRITPALKTAYSYDKAGRVTTYTPAGELPWTLTYGRAGHADTAGDGMLLTASRPTLKEGSVDETNGTATTRVVYDVPTGRSPRAPYELSRQATDSWGQLQPPSDASAVFPADADPETSDGGSLAADAYQRATITYMDASGRQTNTAEPGGHISALSYDEFGNTVRELTAANRVLALGKDDAAKSRLAELSLLDRDSAERAEQLSTITVYSDDGLRALETTEPLFLGALEAEPTVAIPLRKHTVNTYDEGRPDDAKTKNLITTSQTGAALLGATSDADVRVTKTAYDWNLGLPTAVTKDAAGLKHTTRSEYDSRGRISKTTLPKSRGDDAGATVTRYWSADGTGTCAGRPEWADQICTTGPAGDITGGGDNPDQLPTTATEYDRWGNTAKVTESANGQTRTTITSYDDAGRVIKTSTTGGEGVNIQDVTTTYDPATGKKHTTATATGTIAYGYDKLGRQITYTDADGKQASTTYDALDRIVTETDAAPSTTTYTYDTATEPRGLVTKVTDSIAGDFTATYDPDGQVAAERLPGEIVLTHTLDEAGSETRRTYTRASDGEVIASDTSLETVHDQQVLRTATAGTSTTQRYSYDGAGRLVKTVDTQGEQTTTRAYAFDDNTNRTQLTTQIGGDEPRDANFAYDSADRLVDTGIRYDAFGRTVQYNAAATDYYSNDLVHRQTSGDQRTTWSLDPDERHAVWTTEQRSGDTWSPTATRRNHYTGNSDTPAYTSEDSKGNITRYVSGVESDLTATTSSTGDVVLQLANLHDDITVTLPLDSGKTPVVFTADEYGNPLTADSAPRYGWLGAKQRSAETPSGQILMGQRLYDPATGRFLQMDPIEGGSANNYDYVYADPINQTDLDGTICWSCAWKNTKTFVKRNKWNIAAGAATFVPGLGAATWAYRAYRIVRVARATKGMGGGIRSSRATSRLAGRMWVGRGSKKTAVGRLSKNRMRQYRPASYKQKQGRYQSNFEWRSKSGKWKNNYHVNHRTPRKKKR